MDPSALSHTLAGDRGPSAQLLRKLGYKKVVSYEKVWAPHARQW